jgi:hypothetical protein
MSQQTKSDRHVPDSLARSLDWFGIALGATEMLAPRARAVGGHAWN